jgi:hypothetical protein
MPLTRKQLTTYKRQLRMALDLVLDVQGGFHSTGDAETAKRLKGIAEAVLGEVENVDHLLSVLP